MGITPIEHLKLAWHRFVHGIPKGEARQCEYGGVGSHAPRCEVIVAPHEGYREGGFVYCSDEHAAEAQEMQIL